MVQTETLFDRFLHNINPDEDAVTHAQEAHKPLRQHLIGDSSIKDYIDSSFLYGSYKRHTAIGDIKDVDIVLLTRFSHHNPLHSPQQVLKQVKTALTHYYEDADSTDYQRRSIRVNDPLPNKPNVKLTLDVIPAIAPNGPDGALLVPDRELACWIESHPKGHIDYSSGLNANGITGKRFVPLVKIMKWWWKHQVSIRQPNVERPQPKGFWLECLTGNMIEILLSEGLNVSSTPYAELFVAVLDRIDSLYGMTQLVPVIPDPGRQNHAIDTSMTVLEFSQFVDAVRDSLNCAQGALLLPTPEASKVWNQLFGDVYPVVTAEKSSWNAGDVAVDLTYSPNEHFLTRDYGVTERLSHNIRLECTAERNGFQPHTIRSDSPVNKGFGLTFRVQGISAIPKPYDVYWKVKNSGAEATAARQLRGEITRDGGKIEKFEKTRYVGRHYVECYVVNRQRQCIARARHYVVIQ